MDVGPVLGRHVVKIDGMGVDKEVFAQELRELTAYNTPDGTLIWFASVVTPAYSKIKVDGDPQHAGFHFPCQQRSSREDQGPDVLLAADGKDKPGDQRNWDAGKTRRIKSAVERP